MEPAAKEYIQKFKMTKNKKVSASSSILDIKKEEVLNKSTYKYKYIHQGMYIIGIKGMIRKKLGTNVLVTLLDKRWDMINKATLGFLGDMNENNLITYIAPDLMMPVQEFIEKMSFGFQTKGYEEFKGTNLLICIEFIERLTNKSRTRYKVNTNDVI
jgi:hypothetical protein